MIIKKDKLPYNVNAIALFPFLFIKKGIEIDPELLNHEAIHFQQQKELGLIFFLILYGIEFLILFIKYRSRWRAYWNISFENEAYCNQSNLDYLQERKLWSFIKYYGNN